MTLESTECILCSEAEESIEHSFFNCRMSSAEWQKKSSEDAFKCPLEEELQWVSNHWAGKSFAAIQKACFSCDGLSYPEDAKCCNFQIRVSYCD